MHLGIDFLHISMDFGRQVGRQNGPKIGPERQWKKDGKNKDARAANLAPKILAPDLTPPARGRGGGHAEAPPSYILRYPIILFNLFLIFRIFRIFRMDI